jgi:hypothetical protein
LPDVGNTTLRLPSLLALHEQIPGSNLYCVIDAAADPCIYAGLRECAAEELIVPLYEGAAARELAAVAPYLAAPIAEGPLLEWLSGPIWDANWGIFVWSEAEPAEVRSHFRRLSKVRTEDGRILLFRLYDPRILSIFLPICDAAQREEVFGPVVQFAARVAPGSTISLFTRKDTEWRTTAFGAASNALPVGKDAT